MTLVSSAISLSVTARLMGRIGARATLSLGLAFFAVGLAMWTQVPVHGSYAAYALPALVIAGLGGGLISAPNITLGMSGVRADDTGLASGLINVALQMGAAIGVAVLATLSTTRTQHLLTTGVGVHRGPHQWLPPRVLGRHRMRGGGAGPHHAAAVTGRGSRPCPATGPGRGLPTPTPAPAPAPSLRAQHQSLGVEEEAS